MTIEARVLEYNKNIKKLLERLCPELWSLWVEGRARLAEGDPSGAANSYPGAKVHADVRLLLLDAGIGYSLATQIGSVLGTEIGKDGFDSPEGMLACLNAALERSAGPFKNRLHEELAEAGLEDREAALRGFMEPHHKLIHGLSKRMRALETSMDLTPAQVVELVTRRSKVPEGLIRRIRSGGERVIHKHLILVDKSLTAMEGS